MTKKVDTWMPLLVDKYLGDTQHLTTEQHGAYLLLLMTMWKRDGVLMVRDLPQITRLSPARWKACRSVLMELFTLSDDGLTVTQKRLSQELQRSKENTEAKSKAGAKGAANRWRSDGKANGTAIADASQPHWQTGASTSTPIPLPSGVGSDAVASGAAAPPAPPEITPMSAKERVWALGVPLLGDSARSLLGKLAKEHTDDVLVSVLAEATIDRPIDPKAWVIAACEARSKRGKPANGSHVETMEEIFANQRPDWAVKAGFPDRFQAENAGCTAKTAHQFRDGQRVAA